MKSNRLSIASLGSSWRMLPAATFLVLAKRGFPSFLFFSFKAAKVFLDIKTSPRISMSLGTSSDVQAMHNAVDAAYANGVLLVAAAGNDYGGPVSYPAAYDSVIAVSATDSSNNLASFSSIGPQVELAAPGVSVLSTWKGGGYNTISGTSMATPHVSGVAALAVEANPLLSNAEVRALLQSTADDLGALGRDNLFGYGLVDAELK